MIRDMTRVYIQPFVEGVWLAIFRMCNRMAKYLIWQLLKQPVRGLTRQPDDLKSILDILVSDPVAKHKPVAEYMEKPFPVIAEDASLSDIAHQMDRETPAILVKQASGFDIITKSDLIFFLTRQKS